LCPDSYGLRRGIVNRVSFILNEVLKLDYCYAGPVVLRNANSICLRSRHPPNFVSIFKHSSNGFSHLRTVPLDLCFDVPSPPVVYSGGISFSFGPSCFSLCSPSWPRPAWSPPGSNSQRAITGFSSAGVGYLSLPLLFFMIDWPVHHPCRYGHFLWS